jgi:hypothetical protein
MCTYKDGLLGQTCVDIARARALPADGQQDGQTRHIREKLRCFSSRFIKCLCAFDGQHLMLSGEITLSQAGLGRVG